MSKSIRAHQIINGIYLFQDTCSVYIIRGEKSCIAIDFGSGQWLDAFAKLDLPPIERVFLTHHHADQCAGLLKRKSWPFAVDAPVGEKAFLLREGVSAYWANRGHGPCPPSFSVLPKGLAAGIVQFTMGAFGDMTWEGRRVRFISTPGHGPHAMSILIDHAGKQVVFCGDAAHAGATIHQPYHLEWDHWTGTGALAAWEGIERLASIAIDLLCPSHGPVVRSQPRKILQTLSGKLLELYRVKGSIVAGERDHYITPTPLAWGAKRLLPHLYQFGMNGYLLLSDSGEAMAIDTMSIDEKDLSSLLRELNNPRLTAATATHYHSDHVDGLPMLRTKYRTKISLHPIVAEPLRKIGALDVPWLVDKPIMPDELMPTDGTWRWNEYVFRVAHFPGQTWWHACLMTIIDGKKVLFAGDSFQPASRWNGTGGFCSFNGSRFEGFTRSAKLVMRWKPDILVNGHDTYVSYHRSQFEKIARWSKRAERGVKALCPSGKIDRDYYVHKINS